jgi:hypothetical protein
LRLASLKILMPGIISLVRLQSCMLITTSRPRQMQNVDFLKIYNAQIMNIIDDPNRKAYFSLFPDLLVQVPPSIP